MKISAQLNTKSFLCVLILCFSIITLAQNFSYQAIRLNNGNPIIEPSMFSNPSDGENINGPSLIRVPDWIPINERANPSAQYYLYFADHVGDYIRMAWAEKIEGPYTLYNDYNVPGNRGVLDNNASDILLDNNIRIEENHLASPDVIVDDVNQRIIMYFHSGSSFYVNEVEQNDQVTWVSTSPYGLEFYNGIESVHLGSSYFRVFEHAGSLYALDNGARLNRALDASNPWSIPENHDFTTPLWELNTNHIFRDDIPVPAAELRIRHTGARVVEDELHVFYSRRGELQERILLSTIDMTPNWTVWDPTYPPIEILTPNPGWEGGEKEMTNSESSAAVDVNQLRDPDVFEDIDGQIYLIYSGNGEGGLGIAKLYETPETEITLTAIADSHIRESAISNNFGGLSNLRTSKGTNSSENRQIYMKFDLSGISDMDHAVVRLQVSSTSEGPVTVYKTSNNWDEFSLTYGNAPSIGEPITTSYISESSSYVDWNISDYVKENLGSEISVVFDIAPTNSASHTFSSVQTTSPPQLLLASVMNNTSQPIVNLALNKLTDQSSTTNTGVSERAVDGITDGIWRNRSVTHTSSGIGQWWEVDLGEISTLENIVIHNRTDSCCAARLENFSIAVSDISEGLPNWFHTITTSPDPNVIVDLSGVTGRFIRIIQNIDQPLSLAEVEVHGYQNLSSSSLKNFSETVIPTTNKNSENPLLSTYFNTSTNNFSIQIFGYDDESNITVELFDLTGSSVYKNTYNSSFIELPSASLSSGIYFLKASFNGGVSLTKKIFKY